MKTIAILFSVIILCLQVPAQQKLLGVMSLDSLTNKASYTEVLSIDSVSSEELYNRAKVWVTMAFRSGKNVLQLDDKESGTIIIKGSIGASWQTTFYSAIPTDVYFTLTLNFKDGRYRYHLSEMTVDYMVPASQYSTSYNVNEPIEKWNDNRPENKSKYLQDVDFKIRVFLLNLKDTMSKPTVSQNGDW